MSDYDLEISADKVWNSGFTMDLILTNTGSEALINPYVDITGTAGIKDLWGGEFTLFENGMYRIQFEGIIASGDTVDVRLKGLGSPDFELVDQSTGIDPTPIEPTPVEPAPIEPPPPTVEPTPTEPAPADPDPAEPTVRVTMETSANELNALIKSADAGTTFQLEAGTFHFDNTITIDRDDVSVMGAGSDQTRIEVRSNLNKEAFAIGDGDRSGDFALRSGINEGATELELTGSHSFKAGDFVYLARESTDAFYDSIGDETWRRTDVPLRTSIVEVSSVDGNTLILKGGVHFDFSTSETTVQEIDMVKNVTVGGFEIDYGLGQADPSEFRNTLSGYNRDAVVQVEGTSGLHLLDIVAHDVPSLGVNLALSTGVTADGLAMTGAHNKGAGGNGYGVQIRDVYDSSLVNLSDLDMRHSVVFASWRSAVNNEVHVTYTDRDINFHGGRDHGNVVMVDQSIRDANSDIIAPTLFVNTNGTHYGSVTDADTNFVRFGEVVGTRLNDTVQGYDGGAWLDGRGGNDTLTGGSGNDVLIGGAGRDTLVGGAGEDIALYTGDYDDFRITDLGNDQIEVDDRNNGQSRDTVDVEWLVFDDGALRLSDMAFLDLAAVDRVFGGVGTHDTVTEPAPVVGGTPDPEITEPDPDPQPEPVPLPVEPDPSEGSGPVLEGTSGKDTFVVTEAETIVNGYGNWDVVKASVDFTMSDDVEKLELVGSASINAVGSEAGDLILGNDAQNIIQANGGNDRIWSRDGDDTVFGGNGNDEIDSGAGDDWLHGGSGADLLTGGSGADTFCFDTTADSAPGTVDTIGDFESGVDRIDLSLIDADTTQGGDQAFIWNGNGSGALRYEGGHLLGDTDGDGVINLVINLQGAFLDAQDLLL